MNRYKYNIIGLIILSVNILFLVVFTRKQNIDITYIGSEGVQDFAPYALHIHNSTNRSFPYILETHGAMINEIYYNPLYFLSDDPHWQYPETDIVDIPLLFYSRHPIVKYGEINGQRNIYAISPDIDFSFGVNNYLIPVVK